LTWILITRATNSPQWFPIVGADRSKIGSNACGPPVIKKALFSSFILLICEVHRTGSLSREQSDKNTPAFTDTCMNINALLGGSSSITGNGTTSSQAASATTSVSPFLTQVEQRTQSEIDVTTTQISKFGLLKSALSDGQVAAHAMSSLSSSATSQEATKALGTFFNAFNASAGAANKASATTGWTAESQSAKKVTQDLKSALTSNLKALDAMRKLGLTMKSDGTLVQDPKKFAASLAADPKGTLAAMADIGQKVVTVSTNELNTTGPVGSALNNLNRRNTTLTTQQKALKSLEQTMATASASNPLTNTANSTQLAAYHSSKITF
jgi:hypothetical protein